MWSCKNCGKPVYFAERRQSMGFDWHRQCLRCEECGKVLHPGQHAEHKEQPYCYIPCYSALFGPKLFGHGSTVESHQSFGKRSGKKLMLDREFEKKVRDYNEHGLKISGSSKLELTSRLVNGRLVLEGVLRIYWGVQRSIRVKEFEDKRLIAKRPLSTSVLESAKNGGIILRQKSQISNGNPKRESNPFYRHSVHQMSTVNHEQDWRANNLPTWTGEHVTSQEVVQRTLLHRTLSDSNLLDYRYGGGQKSAITSSRSYQTLPANFGRTKSAVVPLRLDRYEALSDLSKECSTLKFDLSSCQQSSLDETDDIPTDYESLPNGNLPSPEYCEEKPFSLLKTNGHRALRRRHGKKFNKNILRRRSSFNGHWYDRETAVFTPPKDSCMSVWITSLVQTREVIQMILEKYKIESESERFALFVVKETGERRLVSDTEYPLVLRVNLGPHEEIARLYIFDKNRTMEVNHEVAQYLRFSYAECRAILNMFYEEEEREVDYIRRKYKLMRKLMANLLTLKWTPRLTT